MGLRVRKGEVLGIVTNPLTNDTTEIQSPFDGRLLGRALNQFVLPGFATFHIGIETPDISDSSTADETQNPETLETSGTDDYIEPNDDSDEFTNETIDEEPH